MRSETLALIVAAASIGSLHTLAPDHWMPFAALGKARGWSSRRVARTTLICGLGHVTVTALFGLVGIWMGLEIVQRIGTRLESIAGILLITFGVLYALWGMRRSAGQHLHGHVHAHYDHVHDHGHGHDHGKEKGVTELSLFLLYSADPCVAVLPLMVAAAPLGWASVAATILAYEVATLATMVALVIPATRGAHMIPNRLLHKYEHAIAGAFIAAVGVIVSLLGI